MKKLVLFGLFTLSLILLTSCAAAPAATPTKALEPSLPAPTAKVIEVQPTAIQPTATQPAPTAAPTELPILPCNITFDSDRDGNREIYSMDPDGANQTNLSKNPADDFDPVWSPDGSQIAFVSNREAEPGGQYIYAMRANGSQVSQISQQGDSQFPDWSPSGSQIAYNSQGDIFLVDLPDGKAINLTMSPETDEQPKFSPDGKSIAWLRGESQNRQVYVMDRDGKNMRQVTKGGNVFDLEWTVDGRIFTHWEQPDGICFNCVVTLDGSSVIDAGGKGAIQEFLPFWTDEGERVEMISADINNTGREDILLVGEIFPDIFNPLTKDSGNNRNPDAAANCGPTHGVYQAPAAAAETPAAVTPSEPGKKFVIGYTGSINPMMQMDFDVACAELDVECLPGKDIAELTEKGVDAIVNASNRWAVMGDFPQRKEALNKGIPFFLLNADVPDEGVYNLSAENEIVSTALTFMFKSMQDKGNMAYYNFGNNDYMQQILENVLKGYPEIKAIKMEANYDKNPFVDGAVQKLIAENPDLGAIWSSELSNDLFWGAVDKANSHVPYMECPAREDMLEAWKVELEIGTPLSCMAFVRPGGTAYEGIYAAYYYLSGLKLNPEMLTGEGKNTLHYAIPEINNESLPAWLGKADSFRVGDNSMLFLEPMSPEQIRQTWFLD